MAVWLDEVGGKGLQLIWRDAHAGEGQEEVSITALRGGAAGQEQGGGEGEESGGHGSWFLVV